MSSVQDSITASSPHKHTWVDFSKVKTQTPMFTGIMQPSQPLHETSFFIDSDVEDTGSETGDSFDEMEMSPVQGSVESVRSRNNCIPRPHPDANFSLAAIRT